MPAQQLNPSINMARIQAVFRSLGYPSGVSRALAGLSTHQTSAHLSGSAFQQLPWDSRQLLSDRHLPQWGANIPGSGKSVCLAFRFQITRADAATGYERLKATLFNCVMHGPVSQNREKRHDFRQHLPGRVSNAVFLNPGRGKNLQSLVEQIRWH